jgi:hypothetical protein
VNAWFRLFFGGRKVKGLVPASISPHREQYETCRLMVLVAESKAYPGAVLDRRDGDSTAAHPGT